MKKIFVLLFLTLILTVWAVPKATFTDTFTSDFSDNTDNVAWTLENTLININASTLSPTQQVDCACWDTGGGATFENCTCFNATARTNCDACNSNIQCGGATTCILDNPLTTPQDVSLPKTAGSQSQVSSIFWNCTTAAPNTCLGSNSLADTWKVADTRNSTCRNTQTLDIWALGGSATANYYSQSCNFCEPSYEVVTTSETLFIRTPCLNTLPEDLYNCYNKQQDSFINETDEDYGGNVCGRCKQANTPKKEDTAWYFSFLLQSDEEKISLNNLFDTNRCEEGDNVVVGFITIIIILIVVTALIATGTVIPTLLFLYSVLQFIIGQLIIFGTFVAKKVGQYIIKKGVGIIMSESKQDLNKR